MRFTKTFAILAASTLLVSLCQAQARGYYGYQQNRDYGYGNAQSGLISRVLSDLGRAARSTSGLDDNERLQFQIVRRELRRFEDRWQEGQSDTSSLDKAIESLNNLANAGGIIPRDRSILANDVAALRDFRSSQGAEAGYGRGGYGRYGGYGRNRGYPSGRQSSESLIDRVMSDLNHAASSNAYIDQHERKHFQIAQQELQFFQERWQQGQFDTGALDRAITSIQHLSGAEQLSQRDRSVLSNDLAALRDFRANRGGGG